MTPAEITELIVDTATAQGFVRVGVASLHAPTRYDAFRRWLADGHAGSMTYLSAPHQLEARRDARVLSKTARTIVVAALPYAKSGGDEVPDDAPRGFIARYARGEDYHLVVRDKLVAIAETLEGALGRDVHGRPCVDSAPLLERDLAEAAGLGFVGKNTMLIAPGVGSYVVLGELLLAVDAAPTAPFPTEATRCGDCTACLDACPTDAFVGPHDLDARRCVSYLTIEHRGDIAPELRPRIGTMVFGCDICQEVCPYNAAAPDRTPPDPALAPIGPDRGVPALIELLGLGANQMRRYLNNSAMRRASRHTLLRNACIALGNLGDARAIPALERAVRDRHPIVRAHAAWALGQLGAVDACRDALADETDAYVRAALEAAVSAEV